ncbi:hypothetical protein ACN27E_12825 [Mycobacterium sp. WMMD1722]|uniref:hypothetical protein n=1 Tax=Mycobacterium sp. WMMD1722 TaxID=3404117 RepID=UPI003BF5F53C
MKRHIAVVAGVTSLLLSLSVGLGGPAGAQPSAEMPDVEGANLQTAAQDITDALTGLDQALNVMKNDGSSGVFTNLTNWIVCWQAPKAGEPVTEDTWVGVGVARPTGC